ncbi:uncharacterized protein GGS25DRAFT_483036 [Hypoxylon fragiforme]|uniref:uncharacterized protein n=1 Tax=Hypoxylon fragiforme TaxID=63214 RepID=UPI0020C66AC3|nr:uncharacterized protein GGS25DRAFT_483036 [Hypoxylon fragiforme]KAI2611514.1 hypothetical protein GGS25DRAFT_483036 [Hypoxylon fragiforme]
MFEYRYRTSPSGRQQFGRSYSFSHHHDNHRHHHRPRCFDNCAGISVEQWNSLCQQNKDFIASNDVLSRENQTLKAQLQAAIKENGRLHARNQQLAEEIHGLRRSHSHDGENAEKFRRRMASLRTEIESKEKEIQQLNKKNETFTTRVDVLTQTVSDQHRRISELSKQLDRQKRAGDSQALFEDVKARLESIKHILKTRNRELAESNAIVEDQRRTIHRLESSTPSHHRYAYL